MPNSIIRRGGLALCLGVITIASLAAPARGEQGDVSFGGQTSETNDAYVVYGEEQARQRMEAKARIETISAEAESDVVVEWMRSGGCRRAMGVVYTPGCPDPVVVVIECLDGSQALEPLFSRTQDEDGSWGPWDMVSYYTCPQDDALVAAISHEWSTLTPSPTTATVQPAGGWVYANMPTIAMVDDTAEDHTVTLLGARVDIRATPDTFTWVWGDGEETVTDDPGAPYPDQTLTHTYAHFEGDVTITLETTWSGEYRINNGAWTSFADTVTSHTPPINLEVRNPHSQLVACTTNGQCR